MKDDPFDLLKGLAPDHPLEGLEADVWARAAATEADEAGLRRVASVQAAVFISTLLVSATLGGVAASRAAAHVSELGVFSPHAALAPSSLILGDAS